MSVRMPLPVCAALTLLATLLISPNGTALDAEAAPPDIAEEIVASYDRGQALYEEDNYEGALVEFGKNLALEGEVRRMIEDEDLGGEFVEGDAYYAFFNSLFRAGYCHLYREEYAAAIELFRKVRDEFRRWDTIYEALEEACVAADDEAGARKVWLECIDWYTANDEARSVPAAIYKGLGYRLLSAKDYAGAAALGQAVEELSDPDKAPALFPLGLAALRGGDIASATRLIASAAACARDDESGELVEGDYLLWAYLDGDPSGRGKEAASFLLWMVRKRRGDSGDPDVEREPPDPAAAGLVREMVRDEEVAPYGLYAAACWFSRLGLLADTEEALRKASNGSSGIILGRIEADPDLEALRLKGGYRQAFPRGSGLLAPIDYARAEREAPARLVAQIGHHDVVSGAAYSPDGKLIATCAEDLTVKLWTSDGRLLRTFTASEPDGPSQGFYGLTWSPDGTEIAACGNSSVEIWVADGSAHRRLLGHRYPVSCAAYDPEGCLIATGSWARGGDPDWSVRIWRRDGRQLYALRGHEGPINCVAWSGRLVYSGSDDGTVRVWDPLEGRLVSVLAIPGEAAVTSLALSPDGKSIVAGTGDGTVEVVGVDGEPASTIRVQAAGSVIAALDREGKRIVTCSASGDAANGRSVGIWSLAGKRIATFGTLSGPARSVSFSPDGRGILLLTRPEGKDLMDRSDRSAVSSFSTQGMLQRRFDAQGDWLLDAALSPDGSRIAACYGDRSIKVWGINGEVQRVFHELSGKFGTVAWSPDGSRIAAADMGNSRSGTGDSVRDITLWTPEGKLLGTYGMRGGSAAQVGNRPNWGIPVGFSPDGKSITASVGFGTHLIFDAELRAAATKRDAAGLTYSPDGRYLLLGEQRRLERPDGSVARELKGSTREGFRSAFSPDSTRLAYLDGSGRLLILRLPEMTEIRPAGAPSGIASLAWSADSRLLTAASPDGVVRVWHADGSLALTVRDPGGPPSRAFFLPGGARLVSYGADQRIRVFDASGGLVRTFEEPDAVVELEPSPDGKLLFSWSEDNAIRLRNVDTGGVVSLYASGADWLTVTPDGYFDSSQDGGRLVAMVKGFAAYGIDQFATLRNRPDLILTRMGMGSPDEIEYFHRQYARRLARTEYLPETVPASVYEGAAAALSACYQKSGAEYRLKGKPEYPARLALFRVDSFIAYVESDLDRGLLVPRASILGVVQNGRSVELEAAISGEGLPLYSYNIYVNGVPLWGASGRSVSGETATVRERFELIPGENRIEVSCLSSRLVESYRDGVRLRFDGPDRGDLYFLGFGVSAYKDPALRLGYAAKDATDLAAAFSKTRGERFAHVYTRVLVDAQVTPDAIRKAKDLVARAKPEDTFVLFVSGHGLRAADPAATYYYATWNADRSDLPGSCAEYDLIEELLQGIAPRRKLFLMDTCESGEIGDRPVAAALQGSKGISSRGLGVKARPIESANEPRATREYVLARGRFIDNDLSRRSGATVFSSSGGDELSYESAEIANGYFTEAILAGLGSTAADADADGLVSATELEEFTRRQVSEQTGGAQNPSIDRGNVLQKVTFPVAGR